MVSAFRLPLIDARNPEAYNSTMKAFLETLGDLGNPKPNTHFSPKWMRSDTIAHLILHLVLALDPNPAAMNRR